VIQRTFDLHIVVWPAEDVPGQWLAHCLELDVVSQGNSLAHAVAMIREAVGLVLSDDLSKGLDPQRRRAPQEDWEAMWKRLQEAHPLPFDEATRGNPAYLVLESTVRVSGRSQAEFDQLAGGALPAPTPVEFSVPVAFSPTARAA